MAQKIRIQKALTQGGVLSRRRTEEYIAQGRITVNGRTAQPGHAVDPVRDVIAIDGQRVQLHTGGRKRYLMLHKPRGYVTTTSDEMGRRCVMDLLEGVEERVYPVGRLDKNSEGLLLLTNDGAFANAMMHPSCHVSKTYRVTVRPGITDEQAVQLAAGVELDGKMTLPAQVHVLTKEPGRAVLQLTIREGRNRQIRRMCEAVGLEVARLKRTSIGPLKLGMLQPGQYRELTAAELAALRGAVSGQPAPAAEEKRPQGKKPARTPEERYRKTYGDPFDRRHLRREEPGRGGKGRRNSWGG